MKGQFYIIASVFVLISLAALFMFTLFVNFGTFTLPTQSTDFDNLQNAIAQRNSWLPNYWYDWTCKNKTVADIQTYTNPLEFDAGINPCIQPIRVFKLSGTTRTEIATKYITASGCNVTFNATGVGLYEIYWNCPTFPGPWPALDGHEISPSKYTVGIPDEGICDHFSKLLPKKNIEFSCTAKNISNTYNYSVSFRATDFTYNGSLV